VVKGIGVERIQGGCGARGVWARKVGPARKKEKRLGGVRIQGVGGGPNRQRGTAEEGHNRYISRFRIGDEFKRLKLSGGNEGSRDPDWWQRIGALQCLEEKKGLHGRGKKGDQKTLHFRQYIKNAKK